MGLRGAVIRDGIEVKFLFGALGFWGTGVWVSGSRGHLIMGT